MTVIWFDAVSSGPWQRLLPYKLVYRLQGMNGITVERRLEAIDPLLGDEGTVFTRVNLLRSYHDSSRLTTS